MVNALQVRLLNWIAPSMPAVAASDYVRRSSIESVLPGIADRVAGKVVFDFGCGGGSDAIHLAQLGAARVTGIDIQERWLVRARKRALEAGLSEDRCAFAASTPDRAGVIVCLDSFEHFADPAEALRQMYALLRPGGSLLMSFGGGWYHPRGGHSFSVFPWAHLLFSERALIQWRSRHKSDGATRFSEIAGGLNQMTLRRFERLVRESAFQIVSLEYVPIRRTRWLHNRLTREFLTALVRCELMRPS
jgi:SAM-dependent methyltransferase